MAPPPQGTQALQDPPGGVLVSFIPPDAFKGEAAADRRKCAKWAVDLLLVANPAGMVAHYDHTRVLTGLPTALRDLTATHIPIAAPPAHMWDAHQARPRGLAKAARVFSADGLLATLAEAGHPTPAPAPPPSTHQADLAPLELPAYTHQCRVHNPADWTYTDGSKQEATDLAGQTTTSFGAGMYDGPTDRSTRVDPAVQAGRNHTITRAEMAALYAALCKYADRAHLRILTDSLSCIQALNNELHRPMHTANHLHRELLEATAGLIMERDRRGLHTTLLKVRAHIGVRGNEIADSVAKLQAHRGMEALLDRQDKAYLHMAQQDEGVSVEVGRAPPPARPLQPAPAQGRRCQLPGWEGTAGRGAQGMPAIRPGPEGPDSQGVHHIRQQHAGSALHNAPSNERPSTGQTRRHQLRLHDWQPPQTR